MDEGLKAYHAALLEDQRFMLLLDAIEAETGYGIPLWSENRPVNEEQYAHYSGLVTGQTTVLNKLRGKL